MEPAAAPAKDRPKNRNERLTKRLVDRLEPDPRGEYVVWDADVPGFGLRVYPSGRMAYFVFFRMGGRGSVQGKSTIAQHGVMTVEQAREEARRRLRLVEQGINPMAERRERDAAITVEDAWKVFHREHVAAKRREKTAAEYQGLFDREMAGPLGKKRVVDISKAHVSTWHAKMADKPATANRALAVFSSFMSWAEERGYRPESAGNPCRKVKKFTETARERFLTDDEILRVGKAMNELQAEGMNPRFTCAFRLLLMTGARHGEIRKALWSWVDMERGIIRLPDRAHKGKNAKTLNLSPEAVEVVRWLDGLRVKENPHLIPALDSKKPVNDLQKPWQKVRARAGVPDVRIHDLRHTYASHLVMGGQSLAIVGKLLGHSQPATTARYAHLADNPLRAATQQFGSRFGAALVSGGAPAEPETMETTAEAAQKKPRARRRVAVPA